jgi:RNA polymerase sigma factor for flagellar operon FliA
MEAGMATKQQCGRMRVQSDATLDDIAIELGISKERVRQIREAAEKKLREDFLVLALWPTFLSRH